MDLGTFNLEKIMKAWKGKDPFILLEHEFFLLGQAYLKHKHVISKSNSGFRSLGLEENSLKGSRKPHREEKNWGCKIKLQLLDKLGRNLVNSRHVRVIMEVLYGAKNSQSLK